MICWHALTAKACLGKLDTNLDGLSAVEAQIRLNAQGKNEIVIPEHDSLLTRWFNQFNNFLIYILLTTALITLILQHWIDSTVILGVVILNAFIGIIQEGKAQRAIGALKKLLSLTTDVIRQGVRIKVKAINLVPGDIVYLNAGDKVPADIRIISSHNLQVNEAILTGESLPIEKNEKQVQREKPLSERASMLYSGTFVTYGIARGLVVATGQSTEIGKISKLLSGKPKFTTPLLTQIDVFGRYLALAIVSVATFIFAFGLLIRHYPLEQMFMAAVAIAVSIIPEGLPAIITIILAIGVTKMAKRNAITRRLASVEALSSVTVICTDKTGTLTKNELTVTKVILSDTTFKVSGSGYNDNGIITYNDNAIELAQFPVLELCLKAGLLCNEAELNLTNHNEALHGNPLDGALLALGLKAKLNYKTLQSTNRKIDVIPFDSSYKLMASLHELDDNKSQLFIKGAPEKILERASFQMVKQKKYPIDQAYWLKQINLLAEQGMRVLALAYKPTKLNHQKLSLSDIDSDLIMLGIVGIIDPPRVEVIDAISSCYDAGVDIKMVTGDHKKTAKAIATQIGIKGIAVMDGQAIDELNDEELTEQVEDINIFARTVPTQKVRLIKALKNTNHIVAMTGDGVNDAPAIQKADIGIAMGIKGTEVAKQASEIVLADDNFLSIKDAIEEGRNVYNNLKKAILFILPNDGAEGLAIIIAILFGFTLPIMPVQILWVNMVTAVTLALALAFEPMESHLMQAPPRDPKEPLLSKFLLWRIGFVSLLFVASMYVLFFYGIQQAFSLELTRTMVVNELVLLEAVYLINCRHIISSVINKEGFFGSKPVLIAIFIVVMLQLLFTYLPLMQFFFKTKPLTLVHWFIVASLSICVFFIIEAEKYLVRKLHIRVN
jgi:calcium-translocating P-type ATPase